MNNVLKDKKDMSNRMLYPDVMRGILILFVVLGHCIQYGAGNKYFESSLYFSNLIFKLIYSFHMPCFMLISGYFFYYHLSRRTVKESVKTRVSTLITPIVLWSFLSFCLLLKKPLHETNLIELYISTTTSNLWFLWAIFVCSLLILFIENLPLKQNGKLFLYLIIGTLFLFIPNRGLLYLCIYMYPYFLTGFFWAKNVAGRQALMKMPTQKKIYILAILTLLFITLFSIYGNWSYIYTTRISIFETQGIYQILIDIYRWLIGYVGSAFILLVVYILQSSNIILENTRIINNTLAIIGKNSLGIYIISSFINPFVIKITFPFSFNWLTIITETILIIVFCFTLTLLIKRSKILNTLLLGGR